MSISGINTSNTAYIPTSMSVGEGRGTRSTAANEELSAGDQRVLERLKQRDREVRAHEQAHVSVGGSLILSGPNYTYQTGPDKRPYAIGGEVTIDTSPAQTAEETLVKADHIRRTALAPADPSPQDRQVAAKADSMASEARLEINAERNGEPDNRASPLQALFDRINDLPPAGGMIDTYA